ncbi:hypothetical protein PsB1_0528 [Candidatus Phycosocius spiralis]|uniref:Uncharacterized protein n=1 Tax=Candidatus Phycosocius spiralis TaxID=2815099 RepID=A0ABQ4PTS1_9PROT|nr:hypothetical protein PsB1_0528 [Candidatus Phycosocius spiralis]
MLELDFFLLFTLAEATAGSLAGSLETFLAREAQPPNPIIIISMAVSVGATTRISMLQASPPSALDGYKLVYSMKDVMR